MICVFLGTVAGIILGFIIIKIYRHYNWENDVYPIHEQIRNERYFKKYRLVEAEEEYKRIMNNKEEYEQKDQMKKQEKEEYEQMRNAGFQQRSDDEFEQKLNDEGF